MILFAVLLSVASVVYTLKTCAGVYLRDEESRFGWALFGTMFFVFFMLSSIIALVESQRSIAFEAGRSSVVSSRPAEVQE